MPPLPEIANWTCLTATLSVAFAEMVTVLLRVTILPLVGEIILTVGRIVSLTGTDVGVKVGIGGTGVFVAAALAVGVGVLNTIGVLVGIGQLSPIPSGTQTVLVVIIIRSIPTPLSRSVSFSVCVPPVSVSKTGLAVLPS